MKLETKSLNNLNMRKQVRLPPDQKDAQTRRKFTATRNDDGMIMRPIARLIARDLSQIEGIGFQEFYGPVARYATVRLAISVSVMQRHEWQVLVVRNVSVNTSLKELIYVRQSDRFEHAGRKDWVFVLGKALYRLDKSSRE